MELYQGCTNVSPEGGVAGVGGLFYYNSGKIFTLFRVLSLDLVCVDRSFRVSQEVYVLVEVKGVPSRTLTLSTAVAPVSSVPPSDHCAGSRLAVFGLKRKCLGKKIEFTVKT